MEPEVIDYIDGDETILEKAPLENLALKGELIAFKDYGFWQSMDTLRDKNYLESLWSKGSVGWKLWENTKGVVNKS